MSLIVRPARPEDWRLWRELRLRALTDAPDSFAQTLADVRDDDDARWQSWVRPRHDALRLFAERDGIPVGMMVVVIRSTDPRRANVYAMWVTSEARRAGVGQALIAAGAQWGRQRGALDLELDCTVTQPAARAFYRRCGFAPTGHRAPLREGSPLETEQLVRRLPPLIMGIVNVTPDSFSDGGAYVDPLRAIEHGRRLAEEGADILDVGGEATNPKASPVSADEELRRVLPVIAALADQYQVSVDTTKASVAHAAVKSGAAIINDVAGGLFDPRMAQTVRELAETYDVTYIAGHLRGSSLTEVFAAEAGGAVTWREVADELAERIRPLPGLPPDDSGPRIWVDPGIGFGKGSDPEVNAALLRHAGDISASLRKPVVVGPSRKRFLRRLLGVQDAGTEVLDAASVLAALAAVRAGAHCVRAHNVALLHTHLTAYNKK